MLSIWLAQAGSPTRSNGRRWLCVALHVNIKSRYTLFFWGLSHAPSNSPPQEALGGLSKSVYLSAHKHSGPPSIDQRSTLESITWFPS